MNLFAVEITNLICKTRRMPLFLKQKILLEVLPF